MERPKKRPRPTLSCRECRNKKLRCDRTQPCQQCVKGQRETLCVFDTGASSEEPSPHNPVIHESPNPGNQMVRSQRTELQPHNAPVSQPKGGVIEDLQARVASLEAIIRADRTPTETPPRYTPQPTGTLSVKGDRCRYYGNGYQSGLFERVQHMATTMLKPSADPDLWALAKEVQGLAKRLAANRILPPINESNALAHLREALPEKDVCNSLIEVYFGLYEQRLVILHKPTFMPFYSDFMHKRDQSSAANPVEAQIYAAMGLAAYHLQYSSHSHQEAVIQWLRLGPFDALEFWLGSLSRRARSEVSVLQTRALIVLSQQARGLHTEDYWQTTNALVRTAMTLGLHRDPNQFRSFSPRQEDLRRRLWWSILEMDLRASMAYGMPAAICPEDTDCIPSSCPDASDLSGPLGSPAINDSCFAVQNSLAQSLLNRLAIVNMISRPLEPASRVRLTQTWRDMEKAIRDRSEVTGCIVASTEISVKLAAVSLSSLYSTCMISVQRSLSSESTPNAECLRAAIGILTSLTTLSPEGQRDVAQDPYLSLFVVEFMYDIHKATTLLSMHLDRCRDMSDTADLSLDPKSLFELLQTSLQVFVERAVFEYSNLKDILSLSISISLARARSKGENERKVVHEGLIDTLRSLHKLLSEKAKVCAISHVTSNILT